MKTVTIILFLIAILVVGCKKEEVIQPIQEDQTHKCAGCPKREIPVLDTIIIKK